MNSHWTRTLALLTAFATVCVACFDTNLVDNPSFDLWCGKKLCGWQTDEGAIKRVPTWHDDDFGVSLLDAPTQISQLSEAARATCLGFDMIADVDPSARARLALDFNDDGIVDFDEAIPALSWKSVQFKVKPPVDYTNVRFLLRKEGAGRAVLAQVRVWDASFEADRAGCEGGAPLKLGDGSHCTVDATCDSGACIGGRCQACARASRWLSWWRGGSELAMQYGPACAEGAGCHLDAHCGPGLSCVAGECQSCAMTGTCAPLTPCEVKSQCASGACVPRFLPSEVHEVSACLSCASGSGCGHSNICQESGCFVCEAKPMGKHCAECTADADCGAGFCTLGICSSCRTDADCVAGESCRAKDMYDFGPRHCSAPPKAPRPRGALCEADAECADGLRCGAAASEPKRCGVACETDPEVCGEDGVCSRPGLREIDGKIISPHRLLPAFAEVAGRVATCFPTVAPDAPDASCSLDAQCTEGACCDGQCVKDAYPNAYGDCVLPDSRANQTSPFAPRPQ